LDLIVDGPHNIAYLRPKKGPAPKYDHNRSGVVFVPRDAQSDDLVAHVVKDSPAYIAGIRDDDVLLKTDEHDAQDWRSNPDPKINLPMMDQPPGTKIKVTLKRGDNTFSTTVVLKDILSP
jgi:C-terminal processing protease CtpA/Prc